MKKGRKILPTNSTIFCLDIRVVTTGYSQRLGVQRRLTQFYLVFWFSQSVFLIPSRLYVFNKSPNIPLKDIFDATEDQIYLQIFISQVLQVVIIIPLGKTVLRKDDFFLKLLKAFFYLTVSLKNVASLTLNQHKS